MRKEQLESKDQLSLDFPSLQSVALKESPKGGEVVSIAQARDARAINEKEELLSMFAAYASKLNW